MREDISQHLSRAVTSSPQASQSKESLSRRAHPKYSPTYGTRGHKRSSRWIMYCCLILALLYFFILNLIQDEDSNLEDELEPLITPPSRQFCSRINPPLVCAHGGDSTRAPPNTADSFKAALQVADCVEVDAAQSWDGELVVLHVRELNQLLELADPGLRQQLVTEARMHYEIRLKQEGKDVGLSDEVKWQVGDFSMSQLSLLSWPGGQKVLTVQEAVTLTSPVMNTVTLDVKTYQNSYGHPIDEAEIAEKLIRLVHKTSCSNCLIWAKSDALVRLIKKLSPGQRAGYIVMNETEASRQEGMHVPLRMQEPEVVGMHYGMVDEFHLRLLHAAGKKLHTWTINDVDVMRRVLDIGVDAIVTNLPKRATLEIEARLEQCGRSYQSYNKQDL